MALTLMIIRHAEKPKGSWPGDGFTPDGVADKESLVIRGWQRAGAWSALFGAGLGGGDYPAPAAIYAANPTSGAGEDVSRRPFETITPLAARLGVSPVVTHGLGAEAELVAEILGLSGVVLLSWEHNAIARAILPAIVAGETRPDLPTRWDGSRFDVVLRFDRDAADARWSFRQLYPQLLSGDAASPVDQPLL